LEAGATASAATVDGGIDVFGGGGCLGGGGHSATAKPSGPSAAAGTVDLFGGGSGRDTFGGRWTSAAVEPFGQSAAAEPSTTIGALGAAAFWEPVGPTVTADSWEFVEPVVSFQPVQPLAHAEAVVRFEAHPLTIGAATALKECSSGPNL